MANKSISTTIGEAISKTTTAGNLDQPRKMQSDSLKFAANPVSRTSGNAIRLRQL
jgi:hypothetical protein